MQWLDQAYKLIGFSTPHLPLQAWKLPVFSDHILSKNIFAIFAHKKKHSNNLAVQYVESAGLIIARQANYYRENTL